MGRSANSVESFPMNDKKFKATYGTANDNEEVSERLIVIYDYIASYIKTKNAGKQLCWNFYHHLFVLARVLDSSPFDLGMHQGCSGVRESSHFPPRKTSYWGRKRSRCILYQSICGRL